MIMLCDTWGRLAQKAESQVNDFDMALASSNIEAMARVLEGPALITAHPPKNAKELTILGAGVIENSSAAIWHLTENEAETGLLTLKVDRIKGAPKGSQLLFQGRSEPLGRLDDFGMMETAAVLDTAGGIPWKVDHLAMVEAAQARKQEKAEIERAIYARAVRGQINGTPDKIGMTVNKLADYLAGQVKADESGEHESTLPQQRTLRERLSEMFKTPFTFNDGITLYIEYTGKQGGAVLKMKHLDEEIQTPDDNVAERGRHGC